MSVQPVTTVVADPARLAALDALAILDTAPEAGFESVVRLATRLCAAPVALVSFVAADRQWFKARVGFPPCETDLDRSVCKYVLAEPDLLQIPDLTADPRTATNPLVTGEPGIRFYVGAPLRTPEGHALGSLCVIDTVPRPAGLTPEQADDLRALAGQVSDLLAMRRALAEQEVAGRERRALAQTQAAVAGAGGDLDTVLAAVSAGALRAVPTAEGAVVELVDGEELEYRATAGTLVPHAGLRVPLHDSLAGRCALADAPILADDVLRDGGVKPHLARLLDMRAAALAPVSRAGRVVGVLKLQSARPGAFTARDLDRAVLFAGVATAGLTAVAEAEAERARRLAQERLAVLSRISAALLTAEDPDRAVAPLLAAGAESLGFDQAYLYDIAPDGRHLRLTQAVSASDEVRAALAHVGFDSPLCGIVAETRRPLVLREVMASLEARYAMARASGIDAYAGYPVMSRGGLVGVVSFCSSREPAFDAGALAFFETVARYLSGVRERLDGEAALRESDARARRAQEAGQVGTFEVDVASGLASISAEFARIYGVPPTGLYSAEAFEALVLPEDRHLASSEATRGAGTSALDVEYRIRRADDGALRWVARRARFARDADGRATKMVGTVRDVTERHLAGDVLAASEAHWRGLFERLSEGFIVGEVIRGPAGAITDWRYLDVNAAWGELVGVDPGTVVGRTIREVFPGIEDAWVDEFADVVATGRAVTFTRQVGTLHRWYEGRAFPLGPERFGVIFLEVTERIQADARRDALLRLGELLRDLNDKAEIAAVAAEVTGTTLGLSRAGYSGVDAAREEIMVERDWALPGLASLAGLHTFRTYGRHIELLRRGEIAVVADTMRDPLTVDTAQTLLQIQTRAFVNLPIMERGRLVALFFLLAPEPRDWSEAELLFIRTVADRTRSAIARAEAEADQRLLNEEISHRLKNTLAMVLSIATQTLRSVPDRAPVEAFEQRIHALSRAHDVLLRKTWASAPAKEVVRAVLAGAGHADRIDVSGPELDLGPRATLSLSLLLHELATNAAKYGALSVPEGRVAVAWRMEGEGDGREVALDWTERGGPPPSPPASTGRMGFGSRIIQMGLMGTGGINISYPSSGLQATMRAPLAQLQQS